MYNDCAVLGNCIGLPFTSTKQFPVIPPFGISEFAGWTSNRSKMIYFFFGNAIHPISQHISEDIAVPRAVYHSQNGRRFVYLVAPDSSTDFVADIPVTGIELLVISM